MKFYHYDSIYPRRPPGTFISRDGQNLSLLAANGQNLARVPDVEPPNWPLSRIWLPASPLHHHSIARGQTRHADHTPLHTHFYVLVCPHCCQAHWTGWTTAIENHMEFTERLFDMPPTLDHLWGGLVRQALVTTCPFCLEEFEVAMSERAGRANLAIQSGGQQAIGNIYI